MEYAICFLPHIPLRLIPEDGGEMLTELLFGDACEVYEYTGTWARVKNKIDGMEGWLTTKMLTFVPEEEYNKYEPSTLPVLTSYYAEAFNEKRAHLLLTGGSALPDYLPDGSFRVKDSRFRIDPLLVEPVKEGVLDTALRYVNSPYLWGGKNALGIDCSGLTQVVYRIHGILLPRFSRQQVLEGTLVPFLQEAISGDLAFFDHSDGLISHVGFVAEGGKVLHASGCVHFDRLDEEGIYSEERGTYTHRLRVIKRYI